MVREPGCPVTAAGAAVMNMLTVNSLSAAHDSSTGSLSIARPGGMTTDAWPPNASGVSLAVESDSATCADATASGPSPNSFERRTRRRRPPIDR